MEQHVLVILGKVQSFLKAETDVEAMQLPGIQPVAECPGGTWAARNVGKLEVLSGVK